MKFDLVVIEEGVTSRYNQFENIDLEDTIEEVYRFYYIQKSYKEDEIEKKLSNLKNKEVAEFGDSFFMVHVTRK